LRTFKPVLTDTGNDACNRLVDVVFSTAFNKELSSSLKALIDGVNGDDRKIGEEDVSSSPIVQASEVFSRDEVLMTIVLYSRAYAIDDWV
jgi:hypothetical protein